jgi:hypothetical protein
MKRIANRSVGQVWVVYQGADHHGPCMQSQAEHYAVRLLAKRIRHVQLLTQFKGRQHRPAGMVLLRHRRPEQSQEALAGDLEEGAAVALHRVLDQHQDGTHQVVHGLRSQARRQGVSLGQRPAQYSDLFMFPVRDRSADRQQRLPPWPAFPFPLTFSCLGKEGRAVGEGRWRVVHWRVLSHLDCRHKAIALAV